MSEKRGKDHKKTDGMLLIFESGVLARRVFQTSRKWLGWSIETGVFKIMDLESLGILARNREEREYEKIMYAWKRKRGEI